MGLGAGKIFPIKPNDTRRPKTRKARESFSGFSDVA
jgi:hypothetical protein